MNDLLRHVGVFPELEQMLCSFGVKKFAMDEAFSACELLLHGGENESEVLGMVISAVIVCQAIITTNTHTQRHAAY